MENPNTLFPVPSQQENATNLAEKISIPQPSEDAAVAPSGAPAVAEKAGAQVLVFPSQAEASSQLAEKITVPDQNSPQLTNDSPESSGSQLAA
jgi:hypothetical protein